MVRWENMFGSVSGSTLRIRGAMARLLEPADTAQRALEAMRRLYRSVRTEGG